MARVAIAYFSGTGNTWHIAQQYAQAFIDLEHEVELVRIEALVHRERYVRLDVYDYLGVGFPVHMGRAPQLVERFIQGLVLARGQRAFLFATARWNPAASFDRARELLQQTGYSVLHEAVYYTGCDYYLSADARRLSEEDMARHFEWRGVEVQEAVSEILSDVERHSYATKGSAVWLSKLGGGAYQLLRPSLYRLFYADNKCNLCGLCVKTCPTHNILLDLKINRVVFGSQGVHCLRCVGVCPKQAIQVGPLTSKMGRYLAPGYPWILYHGEEWQ